MFLERQTWFFRIYFTLTDFFNLLTITWDSKRNVLLFRNQRYWNKLIYFHLCSSYIYVIRATYLFLTTIISKTESSSFLQNCAFHITGLSCVWYMLLYRTMYTHKASDLICLVNTAFAFEQDYLNGKSLTKGLIIVL